MRLQGKVAFVSGAARPQGIGAATVRLFAREGGQVVFVERAGQRIRIPGPALIDEHDIPRFLDPLEEPHQGLGHLRRRLSRPAYQNEQGVRGRVALIRGKNDHLQTDLPATVRGAIFEHLDRRAHRVDRTVPGGAIFQNRGRRGLLRPSATAGQKKRGAQRTQNAGAYLYKGNHHSSS